jgi:hypothetical protein
MKRITMTDRQKRCKERYKKTRGEGRNMGFPLLDTAQERNVKTGIPSSRFLSERVTLQYSLSETSVRARDQQHNIIRITDFV